MGDSTTVKIYVALFSISAFAQMVTVEGSSCYPSSRNTFCCDNSCDVRSPYQCRSREKFCDGVVHCGNEYDELFCDDFKTRFNGGCPNSWWKCKDGRCIPEHWKCDSVFHCLDKSDEIGCIYPKEIEAGLVSINTTSSPSSEEQAAGVSEAKEKLTKWFLRRRKTGTTINKWGHQLPRIATALYLSDKRFFAPGNRTGEEMSYELTIQLLSRMTGEGKLNSNELATYIQALLVTCLDPRNFNGQDLVSQLLTKVDVSNTTNPFDFLVLCNAGEKMLTKDVERISTAYDSQHRPFWTDNQAMATIALACLSARSDALVDERTLRDMGQELKKRQFRNGTVDDLKTTAHVVQALIATDSYKRDFDFEAAIKVILQSQKTDGSFGYFLDSYYILPVLSNTSLLNITSEHCKRPSTSEEEALDDLQRSKGEKLSTQYSVWTGDDTYLRRTWSLKVPVNSSLYDVIETAQKLDARYKVDYNVVDGKPFVAAMSGIQNDVQMGLYWFIYVQTQSSEREPKLVEESPVDVKIRPNQELILWYKAG